MTQEIGQPIKIARKTQWWAIFKNPSLFAFLQANQQKKKTNQPTLNTDVDVDDVEKVPFSVGYAARFNSGQLISFMLSFHL